MLFRTKPLSSKSTLLKPQSFGNPKTTAVSLMLEDYTHAGLNFKKDTTLKHFKIMKKILVTNICHNCVRVDFKNTFMVNLHFHVLRFSHNLSINVMKIAHIMPLNIKTFLYNTKKILFFSRENRHPTLTTYP